MAHQQPIPEIRAAAFAAAREKCALSVEELAHLACLSKKQIQQIENGGRDAFYSPVIKFTAAKKVAQLIQLDEKEAFDSGPQAELPLAYVADSEVSAPIAGPVLDSNSDQNKDANFAMAEEAAKQETEKEIHKAGAKKRKSKAIASDGMQPEMNTTVSAVLPEPVPRKSTQSNSVNPKSSGTKWIWLLPVGAVALLLVQFQPLLQDQLDAVMGKSKPVEVVVLTAAPVDATLANLPAEPPASATSAATPPVAPAIAASPALAVAANPACPLPDASIENYKSPSPNKPGNMVYVKMPTAQIVCVEDGSGKMQSRAMEPGLGYSFYGKPPFKLLTSGLSSAEIFFQGFRVRPSNADSKSILLVEVD